MLYASASFKASHCLVWRNAARIGQIERALTECDFFIAIGTSGTVYPAAGFVRLAKAYGATTLMLIQSLVTQEHLIGIMKVALQNLFPS